MVASYLVQKNTKIAPIGQFVRAWAVCGHFTRGCSGNIVIVEVEHGVVGSASPKADWEVLPGRAVRIIKEP